MRINEDKIKAICLKHGISISKLLAESGVSRNAFYTLARKKNILPKSVTAIANTLGIMPSEFIKQEESPIQRSTRLADNVKRLALKYPEADPDNIRHTLQLLEEKPTVRLRRALTRAQRFNFQ